MSWCKKRFYLNSGMMRDRVLAWLADNVSSHRLQHILGVEQVCVELASCYQVDAFRASQSGFIQLAFPLTLRWQLAAKDGIKSNPISQVAQQQGKCFGQANPLHTDVRMITGEHFGRDHELSAIRNQESPVTSGHRSVCCLSRKNLDHSVQQIGNYSLRYLIKTNRTIHPRTDAIRASTFGENLRIKPS